MLERVRIDGEPVQPSVPEVAELSRQHLVEEFLAARSSTSRWRAAVRTVILLGIHVVTSSQLSAVSCQLSAISGGRAPFLWRDIGNVLRERPAVAAGIFRRVMPLSERHVRGRLDDPGATLLRALEVLVNVAHCDEHILAHLAIRGRLKAASLPAEHDRAFGERQLGVADDAIAGEPQTLPETECPAQPLNRLT